MAKRKKTKKSTAVKKTYTPVVKKTSRRRRPSLIKGNPTHRRKTTHKTSVTSFLTEALVVAGTVIAGSFLLNKIPGKVSPKILGAGSVAGGVFLGMKAKKPMIKNIAIGLSALGALTLVRQFVPQAQVVAGEDPALLGYADEQLIRYSGEEYGEEYGEDVSGEFQSAGEEYGEDVSGEEYGDTYEAAGNWKA